MIARAYYVPNYIVENKNINWLKKWRNLQIRENGLVSSNFVTKKLVLNTLRLRHNGCHFADNTFKLIFLHKNYCILIRISLKCVSKGLINRKPELVQIMTSVIILCMCPADVRWRYNVMPFLIGWALTQNDPCDLTKQSTIHNLNQRWPSLLTHLCHLASVIQTYDFSDSTSLRWNFNNEYKVDNHNLKIFMSSKYIFRWSIWMTRLALPGLRPEYSQELDQHHSYWCTVPLCQQVIDSHGIDYIIYRVIVFHEEGFQQHVPSLLYWEIQDKYIFILRKCISWKEFSTERVEITRQVRN